jgi:hypothetical protein
MMARMRGRHIFCLSLFLLLARPGLANLPDAFNGWQTKNFQAIPANLLEQFAGDDTLLLHEYGFVSGQRREYVRDSSTLSVTLWQMRDATGSYGLFTFFQEPDMEEREGDDSMVGRQGRWLARRGAYVIDAHGESLARDEAPMLLSEIPTPRREAEVLPLLPEYLPEENLVPLSTKFLMGPVGFERLGTRLRPSSIGFDLGAEAALARYRTEGGGFRLMLVSYATPQLAARQLQSFEDGAAAAGAETRGKVYIRRKGSLLAFLLDAPREEIVESLFDGIRYESVITWNERAPSPKDNVGNLLLAAFLLTGFCLLVTLVAGISFGGIRYLAKKFLPWAVFDRPSAMEIIRLNISDK